MRLRRTSAAAGLVAALSLSATACQGGGTTAASDPADTASSASTASASPQASPSESVTDGPDAGRTERPRRDATPGGTRGRAKDESGRGVVADPEHAVDPPGPRDRSEPIAPPDMMVYNAEESLSDDIVERIEALPGVQSAARLSLVQVPLENKVYTIGVVDPASYRSFTDVASANFQEQWDRVAGGELAIDPAVRKRLPVDEDGYLPLSPDGAADVHVGAYAPQVDRIDGVVNVAWGDELGVPEGNALLLRTGTRSPQALRPRIETIVGDRATIQDMDVVAREGLDPDATQTAFTVGGAAEAIGTFRYTAIGGGRIQPEQSWVDTHISTEEVPILGRVTCNRFIMPQLRAALTEVVTRGLGDKINPGEYAGCYYPRFIAGSTTLSNHSFGTALDLNVPGNLRGTVGEMDRTVVAIFKKWGFAWGGDWRYTDPMHFEADRIVDPR